MACNCHKPCNQGVCCSECVEKDTCESRCPACTNNKQEKEEPKSQKED